MSKVRVCPSEKDLTNSDLTNTIDPYQPRNIMQNLIFTKDLTNETQATETILNACRANEAREAWTNAKGWLVTFTLLVDGTHEACLRNPDGIVVALAYVDESDC